MAYDRVEPFGSVRDYLGPAITSAVIANSNRDPKKRSDPFTAQEFLPDFEPPRPKEQSWEEQLRLVELLNIALKGTDHRIRKENADGNTNDSARQISR